MQGDHEVAARLTRRDDDCAWRGLATVEGNAITIESKSMRKSNFALRLQPSLLDEARKLAEAEGVALNQFINVAAADKLSSLRTESYFKERGKRADIPKALAILDKVGKSAAPMKGGKLTK
jgi:hypothetical protein